MSDDEPPVGRPLPGWRPPPPPAPTVLAGRHVRLEPLDPGLHAAPLHAAFAAGTDRDWTYLATDRPPDRAAHDGWLAACAAGRPDPLFFAVLPSGRPAAGLAAYLRVFPAAGTIEIGHLHFAPGLRRTPAATEAVALLLDHAFALGFRRVEWKCDSLNAPSRAAAERHGFTYEGTHRHALVTKGRNRDTSWYAITDSDWPAIHGRLDAWLCPDNFDAYKQQRHRLRDLD